MNRIKNCMTFKVEIQKYDLTNKDLLYFCHIPKTAGSSLISILDSHFSSEKILNLHEWQELLPLMPLDFAKYSFIRGHFGTSIFGLLPEQPITITILRDPLKLMISSYKMVIRQPKERELYSVGKNQTVSELITDPKRYPLTNRQAHHIVAQVDIKSLTKGMSQNQLKNFYPHHLKEFYLLDMPDEELLKRAKGRIAGEFAFFGIVENMEESLFLLHYTFGWKPIRNKVRENISPNEQNSEITSEAMNRLVEMTQVDQKLYDYAKKLFDLRYSQMVETLKEKYYKSKFEKMKENDMVFEMLKQEHKQRN